ncbi:DUF6082 family protein [Streptomyces sp. NPDC053474]|uniref:DUF6082 family protein n=1 Tax=Streptomyces sp. NPDC053474 TaxID=3365704 RepID=UPI0037D777CC
MRHPLLVVSAALTGAAAVYALHRLHKTLLEVGIHRARLAILSTAVAHPELDPLWETAHPDDVERQQSGALLLLQAWVEHWRVGLNVGVHTAVQIRRNAAAFMTAPLARTMRRLTRTQRAAQARPHSSDPALAQILDDAYADVEGPHDEKVA